MIRRPEVSIICCTYNDEQFLRDTLNSFLEQKTNFSFEIIIHDDASTDRTAEIIREYEEAYPQTIKAIYQEENQNSKGKDVLQMNYERARGKYIAICNGRDFWIDEYKLQRQYDYLEKTKNCVLSVHAGKLVDANNKDINEICAPSKMNRFYHTRELINGESGLFVTSSMFFRANIVKKRPAFFVNGPVTDYVLILYLSLFGQVHYMRDVMSCHRVTAEETLRLIQEARKDTSKKEFQEIGEWLQQFDEWTNYSFHEAIEAKLNAHNFIDLAKKKDFLEMDEGSLRQVDSSKSFKNLRVLLLEQYVPQLTEILKRKQWRMYRLLNRRHY